MIDMTLYIFLKDGFWFQDGLDFSCLLSSGYNILLTMVIFLKCPSMVYMLNGTHCTRALVDYITV